MLTPPLPVVILEMIPPVTIRTARTLFRCLPSGTPTMKTNARHIAPALAAVAVVLAAALAAPGALAGQSIQGRVIDPGTGAALPGVHLRLLDIEHRIAESTFSNDSGYFHITAPVPGQWRIAGELLGYGNARSELLQLAEEETVRVLIRMSVDPVRIQEPVVVVGEPVYGSPDIADFHRRRARAERGGPGHFIYGDVLARAAGPPTFLLRTVPGVSIDRVRRGQIVRMRGGCVPALYVDGTHINAFSNAESLDTYVDVQTIEGIEVYRGAQQPGGRFFDRGGCGLVLVWTQHGAHDPANPLDWKRVGIGFGLLLGIVGLAVF